MELFSIRIQRTFQLVSTDKEDNDFMDILNERGWVHKYHVADEQSSKALNCMTSLYRDAIERAGLSSSTFYIVLHFML